MREYKWPALFISLVFGLLFFLICSFFIEPILAVKYALLVFWTVFLVIFVYLFIYTRRIRRIDLSDIPNITFRNMASLYTDKLVGNGILVVSSDKLIFIPTDEKDAVRMELPLTSIREATYDVIFRQLSGVKILLDNASSIGVVTARYEELIELLNLKR